ncbi:hypothetical protein AYO21_02841 [Fonsecaea monophora]|uniref:Uncharacterized protein n=1 Tax=Fonsecaea monophora TaxID=254056 RepID=A0A177FH02_9EURO|nr:hypothetical protein AYO21_02841 [Fonsecaea monophora]KAH0848637.1 putative oxidoreductase [Fonsecaea pedrosoi]OAG42890.1 hypothetical protein AYO21_02841 [Fonsecaea monophora]
MAQDPVVIVTGGVAGIGAAIVDQLLRENARLVVVDLAEEPLRQRQATLGKDKFQYVIGDVSNDQVNSQAVELAIKTWAKIDAVALNAGIMAPIQRICDMASTEVTKIFNVNVVAHVSMLSAAIPHLRKSKGRVIFTSSDAGEQLRWKAWGAYGASKAAVNFFAQALTLEEPDITAIAVYPGIVNTPLVNKLIRGECEYDPKFSAASRDALADEIVPGMTADELEEYIAYLRPRLVEPHQPGSVIAKLAVKASPDLRGKIAFWDDVMFNMD